MFRRPEENLGEKFFPGREQRKETLVYLFFNSKFWMDLAITKNFMETFFVSIRRLRPLDRQPDGSSVSCIVTRLHLYSDALLDTPNADSRT
jgi:hypothetical protein